MRRWMQVFVVALMLTLGHHLPAAELPAAEVPAAPARALQILSASVSESGPFRVARVKDRKVVIRVRVSGAPACSIGGTASEFGILIDSDRTRRTGARSRKAYGDLGVDARIMVTCSLLQGTYFAPVGSVTVSSNADGTTTFEITTRVDQLPSVDFDWIAYATSGDRMVRTPKGRRDRMRFTLLEIILP